MDDLKQLDHHYEILAWGLLLIWIGVWGLIPGNQSPIGVFGIGIILLGLNLARSLKHIPVNYFSLTIGGISLLLGALFLLRPVMGWDFHFQLYFFPTLLILIGLYLLIPAPKHKENE